MSGICTILEIWLTVQSADSVQFGSKIASLANTAHPVNIAESLLIRISFGSCFTVKIEPKCSAGGDFS